MVFKIGDKVINGSNHTVRTIASFDVFKQNFHISGSTVEYVEGGYDFLKNITLVERKKGQMQFSFMRV